MRLASSTPTYNQHAVIRPQFGHTAAPAATKPVAEAEKPMIEIIIENEKDAAEAKKPVSFIKKALNNVSELTKGSFTAGGKKVANETVAIVLVPLGLLLANRLSGGKLSQTLFSIDAKKDIAKKATEKSLEIKYLPQQLGIVGATAATLKTIEWLGKSAEFGVKRALGLNKAPAAPPVSISQAHIDLFNQMRAAQVEV